MSTFSNKHYKPVFCVAEHWRCAVRGKKACPAKVFEIITNGSSTFERSSQQHTCERNRNIKLKAVFQQECCENGVRKMFASAGHVVNDAKLKHLHPDRVHPGLSKVSILILFL